MGAAMRSSTSSTANSVHGGSITVELVRLAVVVLATGAAFRLGADLPLWESFTDPDSGRLLATVIGAGTGYVVGGAAGRFSLGRIDAAERRIAQVSSGTLVAATAGGLAGLFLAAGLLWPLLLLENRILVVPTAALVTVLLVTAGLRVGGSRGDDLLRFVGASGRIAVSAPSRGLSAKVLDTSALVDGRILDVCRAGFLEGSLVLPEFVLYELQGLADSGDDERRERGRRGLDVLAGLQRSSGVAVEVTSRDYPEIQAVDAKLVAMSRDLGGTLVTVDSNLGRVAEVQGIRVLNMNALAETLRPPVLPGDVLRVRVARVGKEPGQGVGYLSDGTMVVVEEAGDRQGTQVSCEVTSLLSNQHGRMVFARVADAEPIRARAAG